MIAAIEQDLVAILAEALPGLKVEPYPDQPETHRLAHGQGAVLVGYAAGRYPGPHVLDGLAQRPTLEFQFVVRVRSLRDHTGAYAVLETIRREISGRDVRGVQFYPVLERFEDVSNGVWTYLAKYAAATPWVSQARRPDEAILMEV